MYVVGMYSTSLDSHSNYFFFLGTYVQDLHKMVYLQNRRFLPEESELRLDSDNFPDKSPELNRPPSTRSYDTLKDIHMAYDATKTK